MTIKISRSSFESGLRYLTDTPTFHYSEYHDEAFEPWTDWSTLDTFIPQLKVWLQGDGELEWFRMGLEWLWNQEITNIADWFQADVQWTDDQVRAVLEYTYKKLYPDHTFPPAAPEGVEIVPMSNEEWDAYKKAHPL